MIDMEKFNRILKRVEKPARYIGLEKNSIKKDLKDVEVKFAFHFQIYMK